MALDGVGFWGAFLLDEDMEVCGVELASQLSLQTGHDDCLLRFYKHRNFWMWSYLKMMETFHTPIDSYCSHAWTTIQVPCVHKLKMMDIYKGCHGYP